MQNSIPAQSKLILNLLVLITVIGFALTGWLVGHILRFSMSDFWHPPDDEINPQIKNGFEFGGQHVVASPEDPWMRIYVTGNLLSQSLQLDLCLGNTYYTSLPAKCRSADGRLVKVGIVESGITLNPQDK